MKKETKELLKLFGIVFIVMLAIVLAYRVFVHFWPPEEKPRQTLVQFLEEAERANCMKLLAKPIVKWSDGEMKLEPEIYAWLKEQGDEMLPWEWTEKARRKDPKGFAKCWRRIWKDLESRCEILLAECRKESGSLDREIKILAAIHAHRTNQIERLRALAATNAFPCRISLERLEKGRLWGWNKNVEVVECKDAAEIAAAPDGICSREVATSKAEDRREKTLSSSLASAKEKASLYGKLRDVCDKSIRLLENGCSPEQDGLLLKTLVEFLKSTKKESAKTGQT